MGWQWQACFSCGSSFFSLTSLFERLLGPSVRRSCPCACVSLPTRTCSASPLSWESPQAHFMSTDCNTRFQLLRRFCCSSRLRIGPCANEHKQTPTHSERKPIPRRRNCNRPPLLPGKPESFAFYFCGRVVRYGRTRKLRICGPRRIPLSRLCPFPIGSFLHGAGHGNAIGGGRLAGL